MVRTKVDMKYVENVQKRGVCFSKRRAGLLKKASELSVLCNADIGVVVFSAAGKLHEFASSSMQQIIIRYITTTGAWSETSGVVVQQADENRILRERVMMLESENLRLESENRSLRKDVEVVVSDNHRLVCENSSTKPTLALTL